MRLRRTQPAACLIQIVTTQSHRLGPARPPAPSPALQPPGQSRPRLPVATGRGPDGSDAGDFRQRVSPPVASEATAHKPLPPSDTPSRAAAIAAAVLPPGAATQPMTSARQAPIICYPHPLWHRRRTQKPRRSAARRAFSSDFSITPCDAVCRSRYPAHATATCTQVADGPGLP